MNMRKLRTEQAKWEDFYQRELLAEAVQAPAQLDQGFNRELVECVESLDDEVKTILEAGCGSGVHSAALARTGKYDVTAMDFAPSALQVTRRLFEHYDLKGGFLLHNLFEPLTEVYDLVFNVGVFEHYSRRQIIEGLSSLASAASKYVMCVVPNPECHWYWIHRKLAMQSGNWPWGKEVPLSDMSEFSDKAGLKYVGKKYFGIEWTEDFILASVRDEQLRQVILDTFRQAILPEHQTAYLAVFLFSTSDSVPKALCDDWVSCSSSVSFDTACLVSTVCDVAAGLVSMEARQIEQQTHVAELAQQLRAEQRRIAKLERQLGKNQMRTAKLEQQLMAQQTRVVELEHQLDKSQTDIAGLERQLSTEQARTAELKQQLEVEQKRSVTMEHQLGAERTRAAELRHQLEAEQKRTAELERRFNTEHTQAAELKQQLEAEQKRSAGLKRQFSAEQARIDVLEQQFQKQLAERSTDLVRSEEQLAQLQEHVRAEEVDKQDVAMKLQRSREQVAGLGQEVRELHSRLHEVCMTNEEYYRRLSDLYNSVGWPILRRLYWLRQQVIPHGSRFERVARRILRRDKRRSAVTSNRLVAPAQMSVSGRTLPEPAVARHEDSGCQGGPLISVVLPVYNQSDLLEESIESVLKQTYKNYELIVIDDGSEDGIDGTLAKYADNPKVLMLTQEHQGLAKALTNAFHFVSGKYLTWTSADNLMHPEQLEKLTAFLEAHPDSAMVYSDYYAIDDSGNMLTDSRFRPQNRKTPTSAEIRLPRDPATLNVLPDNFIGASFLYRRSTKEMVGQYDPQLGVEDYDYWMRINALLKIEHIGTDDLLYYYRVHDNSLNARAKELKIPEALDRLMAYEQERTEFYSKPFALHCDSATMALPSGAGLQKPYPFPEQMPDSGSDKSLLLLSASQLKLLTAKVRDRFTCVCIWCTDEDRNSIYRHHYALEKYADACLTTGSEELRQRLHVIHPVVIECATERVRQFAVAFGNNFTFYKHTRSEKERGLVPPGVVRRGQQLNVMLQVDTYSQGGVEQVILDLAGVLDAMGARVYFCACQPSKAYPGLDAAGIRCLHLDPSRLRESYRELLRRHEINVVNAHYSLFGADICRELRIPFVQTIHNCYAWLNAAEKQAYRDADRDTKAYVCVSRNVAWYANEILQLPAGKMVVVPNGVDTDTLRFREELRPVARERFGLRVEDYALVNAASLYAPKAQRYLVEAFAEARKDCPGMRLILAGRIAESLYAEDVRRRARKLGVADSIIWAGYVDDMKMLYHAADALVLPSFWEGCSLAVAEAVSMGLPFLSGRVGAVVEQTDMQNLVLVDLPFDNTIDLDSINLHHLQYGRQPEFVRQLAEGMRVLYRKHRRKAVSQRLRMRVDRRQVYPLYYHLFQLLVVNGSVEGSRNWLRQLRKTGNLVQQGARL